MDFIFRTVNSYVHDINGKDLVILSNLTDFAHIFEVKLNIDMKSNKITEAKAIYYKTPYKICEKTKDLAVELNGISIKKGVLKELANVLSGENGCVHLFELVENAIKLASTILIGKDINYFSDGFKKLSDEEKIKLSRQYLNNTCYAYSNLHDKEKA
jgi:hypothetical protein